MLLRLIDISKTYGNITALSNVNLEIKPGITAIVGPNGAGKTTLLRIMVGLLRPTTGRIEYYKQGDFRRWVRFISTEPNIPMDVRVKDYISFIEKIVGVNNNIRKASIIDLLDIQEVQDRYIAHLSTGYKKRVAIAVALIANAELIVADEPFSGLDPLYRRSLRDIFRRVYDEFGVSFVISSHNLGDMELISDEVIAIDRGYVYSVGNVSNMERAIMLAVDNLGTMEQYLLSLGYKTTLGESYIIVYTNDIKHTLRDIGKAPCEILGIQTVTLEEVMLSVKAD